jgi:hypothetical protein
MVLSADADGIDDWEASSESHGWIVEPGNGREHGSQIMIVVLFL